MINFSVILPCYNSSEYIVKSLDSVLMNLGFDDELIVIDDGSTDETEDILREYDENERVKVIYQENLGPNAARNNGIRIARKDWIIFIDSDDIIVPGALDKIRESIRKCYADILVYGIGFQTEKSFKLISKKAPKARLIYGLEVWNEVLAGEDYLGICWNKVYNREKLLNSKVEFLEDKGHGRDILFTKKIGLNANSIAFMNEVLCLSTYRAGSYSRSFSLKNIESALEISIQLRETEKEFSSSENIRERIEYAIGKHLRYILIVSAFRARNKEDYECGVNLLDRSEFSYKSINKLDGVTFRKKDIAIAFACRHPYLLWYVAKVLNHLKLRPY